MVDFRYEIDNKTPGEKKRFIRGMFASIVPAYDLLNRILSLGVDRGWRRTAIRMLGGVKGRRALDLCCGTGDLTKMLAGEGAEAVSLDFCIDMILEGRRKGNIAGNSVTADASALPFRDNSFDVITIAFGIRNIPDLDVFIADTRRVLRDGGRMSILELTRPRSAVMRIFHGIYVRAFVPLVGRIVSGRGYAYRYLSETVSTFIDPDELARRLGNGGFHHEETRRLFFGAATVICVRK
jgi:demethylmenaquinone methyltransferase / 2-methoxy-6-polyprenyl-1,4-benzoquinol methylase